MTAAAETETKTEPRCYRSQWGLLGEWWCVAADLSVDEQERMAEMIRTELQLGNCPLDYVHDRLFGGFPCANSDERRHVYLNSGAYSYIAASEGGSQTPNGRRGDTWEELLDANVGQNAYVGGGPWTELTDTELAALLKALKLQEA